MSVRRSSRINRQNTYLRFLKLKFKQIKLLRILNTHIYTMTNFVYSRRWDPSFPTTTLTTQRSANSPNRSTESRAVAPSLALARVSGARWRWPVRGQWGGAARAATSAARRGVAAARSRWWPPARYPCPPARPPRSTSVSEMQIRIKFY